MAASVHESQHLAKLFDAGKLTRLFSDGAEMRAMLLTHGALAKAQGALGIIPETSAAFLHRAAMEIQVDPAALAEATAANGVSVPAYLAQVRKTLDAPEHAQYLHWGATSQDILDTALMLRLKQAFGQLQEQLTQHLKNLAQLSGKYSETPMPARTWGQHATPTSFGAVAAAWGRPLLALHAEMTRISNTAFWVSLSGASGTGSALGPKAAETRAALAGALGLHDPGHGWHSDRTPVTQLAAWAARLTAALAKMGKDLTELGMTGIGEVQLGGAGRSSTMPQKQNPVGPGVIVALSAQTTALNSVIQNAAAHAHQREGAAWMSEWLALPQLVLGAGAALTRAEKLSAELSPDETRMRAALGGGQGLIFAEALSFALAETMPRPEAQAAAKALCLEAQETGKCLETLARESHPDLDTAQIFDPEAQLGSAPAEARAFADEVRQL
ncbi:adenylosuccinate lyase family protein [Rhodobacteraceae bacterium 63075]|nr:adenylosuccinate lyase family protein [Rhodobacteraceae bacterium 63075]